MDGFRNHPDARVVKSAYDDRPEADLLLRAIKLDVTWLGGRWVGEGAERLDSFRLSRTAYRSDGMVPETSLLHWPKRLVFSKLDGVQVEIRPSILDHQAAGVTQEQADHMATVHWPEGERQQGVSSVQPFALVAEEGGRLQGELWTEWM